MLHKNMVQYRIRKAEESLGLPVGNNRHDAEPALQASHWLGSYVLRPTAAPTPARERVSFAGDEPFDGGGGSAWAPASG
jgi:hypothetical protein